MVHYDVVVTPVFLEEESIWIALVRGAVTFYYIGGYKVFLVASFLQLL